jgi:hypothetical protein
MSHQFGRKRQDEFGGDTTPLSDKRNRPVNKHSLTASSTRLWCPVGCGVQPVTDFQKLNQSAVLECGHSRDVSL